MQEHTLLCLCVLLGACAPAPAPQARPQVEPDPTNDTLPPRAEPTADVERAPATRNAGYGPYDSLQALCGQDHQRCRASEPVALRGGGEVLALASFTEGVHPDGSAHLAFQTREGWYVSHVPDGQPFGGGLSHHTPAGTHFDLERASERAGRIKLQKRFGQSVYYPGQGSRGGERFEEISELWCRVEGHRVKCGEPKVLFSESCKNPDDGGPAVCKTTGSRPAS